MSVASLLSETNHDAGSPIRSRTDTTWLYFLNVNNDRVKIGESRNWQKRFKQHQASKLGFKTTAHPLCWLRACNVNEKEVLRYFDRFLLDGEAEVFSPSPEILDYVRWLRDQYYVATPDMSPQEIEQLDAVDFLHWQPSDERRKPGLQWMLPGMMDRFWMPEREITGDDFYTNKVIIDAARELMGTIDLDPASHPVANREVKAFRFYSKQENGLNWPWGGNVWLNPPFSAWQEWVPKVRGEWKSGRINQMCVLSAMRTVTAQYFGPLISDCVAVCIIRGRIRFWGGVAGDSPDDGHAIFYFGKQPCRFRDCFRHLGSVFFNANSFGETA